MYIIPTHGNVLGYEIVYSIIINLTNTCVASVLGYTPSNCFLLPPIATPSISRVQTAMRYTTQALRLILQYLYLSNKQNPLLNREQANS